MTPQAQPSWVTSSPSGMQGCRTVCENHRCASTFWKLHNEVQGEELRKRSVSATGEDNLETQVEVQSLDLDRKGLWGLGQRGHGSSTLSLCSGFSGERPVLQAHLPWGSSGHPDTLKCRPNAFCVTALAGCLEAGSNQILFFLLRPVPRVTFRVEGQLLPLRPPQPQPSVEVISSSSHLFREKTLPSLVAGLALLGVSLRGGDLSKWKSGTQRLEGVGRAGFEAGCLRTWL